MTDRKARLDAAYRSTSYAVDGPHGRFVIRVGEISRETDALASEHNADAWAYVTAYNPGSAPESAERNESRRRELEQAVATAGLRYYHGEGRGDDGAWPAEPSLLILGVTGQEASALARRFGQAAFVFGERGAAARLVWTGH